MSAALRIDPRTRHIVEAAVEAGWATQESGDLLDDERDAKHHPPSPRKTGEQ